jgi:hypothetical protein
LYEGSRQYIDVFETLDEFHEYCEYFYVHIGEAEKDHRFRLSKQQPSSANPMKTLNCLYRVLMVSSI